MAAANNNRIKQSVAAVLIGAAILGAWGYAATRASDDDLNKLKKQHVEDVKTVKKSVKNLETNTIKVCQFLDRMDKQSGGPGLGCKDPE